jgi:hypothetical protein
MFNLGKAVTIVFVVLIFAMGRKTGLIIGLVLFSRSWRRSSSCI